jgi:hypothetical protein
MRANRNRWLAAGLFSLLLLSIGLLRLPVYCLQIETLSTGAGFGRQWWKNFPLSMEEFPLHGGRNSPPMVEGFTALSWKEIGSRGRISPANVEGIPRYGGRISPSRMHLSWFIACKWSLQTPFRVHLSIILLCAATKRTTAAGMVEGFTPD